MALLLRENRKTGELELAFSRMPGDDRPLFVNGPEEERYKNPETREAAAILKFWQIRVPLFGRGQTNKKKRKRDNSSGKPPPADKRKSNPRADAKRWGEQELLFGESQQQPT